MILVRMKLWLVVMVVLVVVFGPFALAVAIVACPILLGGAQLQ